MDPDPDLAPDYSYDSGKSNGSIKPFESEGPVPVPDSSYDSEKSDDSIEPFESEELSKSQGMA